MFHQQVNQPYYEIKLSEIDDETIGVLRFQGEEEISGIYEYRIDIVCKDPSLDSSKILNKPAVFSLIRGEETPEKINGIISSFEQYGRTDDYTFYKLTLVPKLWRLNLVFQNEIYQEMRIDDIIKELLSDIGLKSSSYKIDLKGTYPKQEYVVQYRETNLNFLKRRLEHFGIYFFFDNTGDTDVVVFTDSKSKLPEIHSKEPVGFNENIDSPGDSESVFDYISKEKIVTGAVQLKDYNYLFPEKQLVGKSQIDPKLPGLYYDYGDNFENEKDAETLARIRNQEFLSDSILYKGVCDSRLFRAGHKFRMETHYRESWNTEYIITSIAVKGAQYGIFANLVTDLEPEPVFECNFTAIPGTVEYRPKRTTPVPRISGVMNGRIDGPSGEEIFIDEHGRYKSKMFFDVTDTKNGEASLWIRLQQSSSGSGYGIHFPNRIGTELIWACVDGNVDRPVGLGTIPNPSQATPVADKNKLDNIVRTASGNQIVMHDKKDESHILIQTADSHKIFFDDKEDKIEITTKEKHSIIMDDKNKYISIWTKDGHTIFMDDQNKSLAIFSKNEHSVIIDDKDGGELIQISDKDQKNMFLLDITNNKIVIQTKEGSIDLLAPKGEIKMEAKKITAKSDTEFSVKANDIKMNASNDFQSKALNISSEAQMDLKQKANNVTSEANISHKSKGLSLTIEAGMSTEVKGTMVTVQATGPNTIKGLPVLIN